MPHALGSTLIEILIALSLLSSGIVCCLLNDIQRQQQVQAYQQAYALHQHRHNQYEQQIGLTR